MSRNSSTGINGVAPKKGMVLPFTPLAMSFDDVNYYVDMPPVSLISFFTLLSLIFFLNCRNIIFCLIRMQENIIISLFSYHSRK